VTVILSSHNLAQIQDRVDEVALLRNGVLKAFGTVPSLRAALNLPVTIRLGVGSEGHAAVDRLAAAMPDCRVTGDGAGTLQVTCSQHDKVAVLSRLLASGIALTEVSLREPSLEEVFIEFSAAANEERRDG
jgi:Cu-processing system ATP-binding protein